MVHFTGAQGHSIRRQFIVLLVFSKIRKENEWAPGFQQHIALSDQQKLFTKPIARTRLNRNRVRSSSASCNSQLLRVIHILVPAVCAHYLGNRNRALEALMFY